tara:strand:+ start:528 stop:710 length:183 start_codon:yes stop_codon:yes gene_type:complete
VERLNRLRHLLENKEELIQEAFYFIDSLISEDYDCEKDKEKLEEELEAILKELNNEQGND